MVKLASIDLGSNSTRILIADVNDEKFDVLERMHVVTKMSENIEQSKEISKEASKLIDWISKNENFNICLVEESVGGSSIDKYGTGRPTNRTRAYRGTSAGKESLTGLGN